MSFSNFARALLGRRLPLCVLVAFVLFNTPVSRPTVIAGGDRRVAPAVITESETASDNSTGEMPITIAEGFVSPSAIAFSEHLRDLIVLSEPPAGFEVLTGRRPFSVNGTEAFSGRVESLIAVRRATERFYSGELLAGSGNGTITRISADGENVSRFRLPREKGAISGGLAVDYGGAFGGSLLAATADGRIWSWNGTRARLLTDVHTPLAGLAVIPDNAARYGVIAGKLIAAAPSARGLFAIASDGTYSFFPTANSLREPVLIEDGENLFAVSSAAGRVIGFGADRFASHAGELLAIGEGGNGLEIVKFDGSAFMTTRFPVEFQIDRIVFAPRALGNGTACTTSISAAENAFGWLGGDGSFDITAPPDCAWTVTGGAPWLRLTSPASGIGNGTVTYSVAKNGTKRLRESTLLAGGFPHRVRVSKQSVFQCAATVDNGTIELAAAGGAGTVSIAGDPDCAWIAATDGDWITLSGQTVGSGSGTVSYAAVTNFNAAVRRARVALAGGFVTINQAPNLPPTVSAGPDQMVNLPLRASLSGSVSDDGIGNPPTVSWRKGSGPASVIFSDGAELSTTAIFSKEGTYVLELVATDGYLTSIDQIQVTVGPDPTPPPPDPSVKAPPINPTVPTNPFDSTKFLYSGPDPIQTGVNPEDIKADRAGLLSGRVVDKAGQPISNVKITVADHPEFGETRSRMDGNYDLVVNGGGELTLRFEKVGFIAAQREQITDWQNYSQVDDVVLVPFDENVTFVDLSSSEPVQVAESGVVSDADGSRRSRLFFKSGTTATMTLPDNSTRPISEMHVRSTEFTVGPNGPETMPAALPATSEYTYASEYSVDEAVALGATNVSFSQPVIQYLENFLGFPTGAAVPTGSYDRLKAEWLPETSGRVVAVLSVSGGTANLDLDGSGTAASDAQYAALGIDLAERRKLAELYATGQTLWRVPLAHFTPWDCNYPPADRPPPDVAPPFVEAPLRKNCDEEVSEECSTSIEEQETTETIEILNTGYQIIYDGGDQGNGGIAAIPLVGPTPPPKDLENVAAIVTVAGKTTRSDLTAPSSNLTLDYRWDGTDYADRRVQGPQTAFVKIVHLYPLGYTLTGEFGQPGNGTGATFVRTGTGLTSRDFEVEIGQLDRGSMGLGGWSLNVHHTYDPVTKTLYEGNGTKRRARSESAVVNTSAGTGDFGFGGDGGPATSAKFSEPSDVAFAPDGSYYVADRLNNRIRRIGRDGIITTFAGNGTEFCDPLAACGDGGPATDATLSNPVSVGIDADGNVFVSDTNRNRIRKIDPSGIITTVAGDGAACEPTNVCGDGGPAVDASLSQPQYLKVAPDGSIYFADRGSRRVRKISTNGKISTIAGSGNADCPADDVPALEACIDEPTGVAIDDNGTLFITGDGAGNSRVFRLDTGGRLNVVVTGEPCGKAVSDKSDGVQPPFVCNPRGISIAPDGRPNFAADNKIFRIEADGTLATAFGTLDNTFNGEGQPVNTANFSLPAAATFAPDGNIYVSAANDQRIRRITPALPGFSGNSIVIPSEDGSEVFQFDASGRHLRTLNGLTGTHKHVFAYDPEGRLISVTDGDGNVTTIERNSSGAPTGIRSPYNQLTAFSLDKNGYLASVTNPAGEAFNYTYADDGKMLSRRDPLNRVSTFEYDADRRLIGFEDAENNVTSFSRTGNSLDFTVTKQTPLNRTSTFRVRQAVNGDEIHTATFEDGSVYNETTSADGSVSATDSDGSIFTTTTGPDPRWGMQAPLESAAVLSTPGGLNTNAGFQRTASLATPGNPLSLISQTDSFSLNGRNYTNVFTASSRTYSLTTPENRQASASVDGQERLTQAQFADLNAVNYVYDSRGRLSNAEFGNGAAAREFSLSYNPAGLLSSYTNPLNQTTSYFYDAAGRIRSQTLADNRVVGYGYDANGNLTSLTPPGRPAHTFTYDSLNRISSYAAPNVGGSSTTTFEYNPDRDITRITRPDSQQINLSYDTGGRLQTLTVPTGSSSFAYQPTTGLLSSISTSGGGGVAFQYDGFLPVRESWTGAVAGNVSRSFDANLRLASQSVNDANTVNFTYDNDGLLTVAGNLTVTRNATNGLPTGTALGSVTDTFIYNGFAEPTSYNSKFNAATLYDYSVNYDKLGRITQKTETIGGTATVFEYGYDSTGRLITVTINGAPQPNVIYSYDDQNNRTSVNVGGAITTAVTDAQDRLTNYGATTYSYTANGELQTKTNGGQTTHYVYDLLGNLRNVTLPDGTQIEYVIDGTDRRIGKKINGTLTQGLLYQDRLAPVAELDGSNNIVSRFVYGTRPNVPDYMIKSGATYRLIADQLGSVRLVVDTATGNIAQRIDYDEFGVVLLDTSPGFQPFGFAGGIYDPQTKLVRFGARDYDAETGRWTAKDPILFLGGDTNLYTYVFNDPINFIDSNGRGGLVGEIGKNSRNLAAEKAVKPVTENTFNGNNMTANQIQVEISKIKEKIESKEKELKNCKKREVEKKKKLREEISKLRKEVIQKYQQINNIIEESKFLKLLKDLGGALTTVDYKPDTQYYKPLGK